MWQSRMVARVLPAHCNDRLVGEFGPGGGCMEKRREGKGRDHFKRGDCLMSALLLSFSFFFPRSVSFLSAFSLFWSTFV